MKKYVLPRELCHAWAVGLGSIGPVGPVFNFSSLGGPPCSLRSLTGDPPGGNEAQIIRANSIEQYNIFVLQFNFHIFWSGSIATLLFGVKDKSRFFIKNPKPQNPKTITPKPENPKTTKPENRVRVCWVLVFWGFRFGVQGFCVLVDSTLTQKKQGCFLTHPFGVLGVLK